MIGNDRIRLRAPERNDIPLFVAWLNDGEVTAGLLLHLPMSSAEEERWFEGMLQREPASHPLTIEICGDNGTWLPIGNIGFTNIDWRCRSAEVGIVIGEKTYWDKGYGTQAMRLMLKHGFGTLNFNRIFLEVFATNTRAIRSYEKTGFIKEGVLRQAMYKYGKYIDVLLMSVLREEYTE